MGVPNTWGAAEWTVQNSCLVFPDDGPVGLCPMKFSCFSVFKYFVNRFVSFTRGVNIIQTAVALLCPLHAIR